MAVAFLSYRGVYGFYRVLEPTCHGILESPVYVIAITLTFSRRNLQGTYKEKISQLHNDGIDAASQSNTFPWIRLMDTTTIVQSAG